MIHPLPARTLQAGAEVGPPLESPFTSGRLTLGQSFLCAVAATAATLALRLAMDGPLEGRPTLAIFTMPIMLSAYLGGLRAGLFATGLSFLAASYYLLPPLHSFQVVSGANRWQQFFVAVAGVFISVLNEALHRSRRRALIATRERQQAEDRLRPLKQSIEGMLEGIQIIDRQWRYLYVNSAAARQGRHSPADLVNRTMMECFPGIEKTPLFEEMKAVMETNSARQVVNEFSFAGGTMGWFELSIEPDPNGILIRSMDITARHQVEEERKRAEEARRTSEAHYRTLFECAPDGIVIADPAGRYLDANGSICQMLGYAREELIGQPSSKIVAVTEAEHIAPALRAIHGNSPYHREWLFRRKDGSFFDAEVIATKMPDGNVLAMIRDFTERKRAEIALRDSEQKLRKVIDGLGPSTFLGLMTPEGVLIEANRPGLVAAGIGSAEVLGKPFDQTYWWSHSEPVRQQLRAAMARGAAGEASRYNVQVRVAGDALVWIDFSLNPVRDPDGRVIYLVPSGNIIDERVRAEEALLQAGALQRAIFNSANFSCIATDTSGVIQIFNVGAERMLGYTAAEVVKQITPAELHDPYEVVERAAALSLECGTPLSPGFEALIYKAARGIEDIYELTKVRKDGSRFPAVVSISALRDGLKGIIGYLFIGTDNTARHQVEEARKRVETALHETNLKLESAKFVAEKANLAKSDFLSSMSHELRTPLNAILGFAQLLESANPGPTPAQSKSVAQILQAGWYLLKLINEILDLAVIESGKVSLSRESVSLAELLSECHGMMEPQAQKRGIRLTFPRFEQPLFVTADRTRLKQILINLLSNAIKYNREQGHVVVDFAVTLPERIRITVTDTGRGLPPENVAQLFSPFNRLGQETGSVAGTGIGLVVSKRLVELMGGAIGAESTVGVGSVFWCEMDAAEPPRIEIEGGAASHFFQSEAAFDARQRTLLYVEDNPANLQLVEELLKRFPRISLKSAANATRGIDIATALQPAVILMDINLPGISGFKALQILRANPDTAHIPVIALSANAMPRDIEKGLEAGFFRYLTKPIKIKEFMETLNAALELAENLVPQNS